MVPAPLATLLTRLRLSLQAARQAWRADAGAADARRAGDLAEILEGSTAAVLQFDVAGRLLYVNPAGRRQFGLDRVTPTLSIADYAASGTQRQLQRVVMPALRTAGFWVGEFNLRLAGSRSTPYSLMALGHRDAEGRLHRYSAVLRDQSADARVRIQVQRQNTILTAIAESLPATVVIVDSQGRYRFVNSAFERLIRRQADSILGRTAVEILGAAEVARRAPYMRRAMAGEVVEFTLDYPGPDGIVYRAMTCTPLNVGGMFDGFVGISQDVTEHRRENQRLADMAERDPLTGLLNRAGLAARAAELQDTAPDAAQALIYIDLDHFKPINDRYGHGIGDLLLNMFAIRLRTAVRTTGAVARLGGDEFAILLSGSVSIEGARRVADEVLSAACEPFVLEGRCVRVSASIGVAVQRSRCDLSKMLASADRLLYEAKEAGRGIQVAREYVVDTRTNPDTMSDTVAIEVH